MSADFSTYDAGFTAYENGKHRRYELLFAVNGGAFALAKLSPNVANAASVPALPFLGYLSVDHVALGMIAFSVIMFLDIAAFGRGLRNWHYRIDPQEWSPWNKIFSLIGFFALFVLSTLLCGAWHLVQDIFPRDSRVLWLVLALFVLCAFWCLALEKRLKRQK